MREVFRVDDGVVVRVGGSESDLTWNPIKTSTNVRIGSPSNNLCAVIVFKTHDLPIDFGRNITGYKEMVSS